ncbi:MAG: hypothetical protein ACHQM4_08330 [Thermoanaerobaculia bacterium]
MNYKALILAVILGGATAAQIQESTPVPTPLPPPIQTPAPPPEITPQLTPPRPPEGTPRVPPAPEIIPTPNPTPELRGSRTPGIPKFDPLRTPGISRTPGGDPGDRIAPTPTLGPAEIHRPPPPDPRAARAPDRPLALS